MTLIHRKHMLVRPIVTWDPSQLDKCTISGAGSVLTVAAAYGAGTFISGCRATVASSGFVKKKYVRYTLTTAPTSDGIIYPGLCTRGTVFDILNNSFVGVWVANSIRMTGNVYQGDTPGQPILQGDILDLAHDEGTGDFWVRKNGAGIWNNGGTADPATGLGAFKIIDAAGAVIREPLYPFVAGYQGGGAAQPVITAAFADDGSGTLPLGFRWLSN